MAGSLDIHIASLEDSLIDGVSFANRATASYITGRKSTSFPTQSGGTFSPQNLLIMRFTLNDADGAWLDGSTIRLAFTLNNLGTSSLNPVTLSPASLFRRLRLICGGTEIFDLLSYGRCHELFTMQLPHERQATRAKARGTQTRQAATPRRSRTPHTTRNGAWNWEAVSYTHLTLPTKRIV